MVAKQGQRGANFLMLGSFKNSSAQALYCHYIIKFNIPYNNNLKLAPSFIIKSCVSHSKKERGNGSSMSIRVNTEH